MVDTITQMSPRTASTIAPKPKPIVRNSGLSLNPTTPASQEILEVWIDSRGEVKTRWVPPRPVPADEGWFEEVWKEYREGRVID